MAGTIFADSGLPLVKWFQAVWLVTNQRQGTSARDLQRAIGVSYETSWTVLHKLRRAMGGEGRERLAGVVEVDVTYVGGAVPGRRGSGALGTAIVAVAVERHGLGEKSTRVALGRTRIQRIPDVQMATLTEFVLDTCDRDAIIHTIWPAAHLHRAANSTSVQFDCCRSCLSARPNSSLGVTSSTSVAYGST